MLNPGTNLVSGAIAPVSTAISQNAAKATAPEDTKKRLGNTNIYYETDPKKTKSYDELFGSSSGKSTTQSNATLLKLKAQEEAKKKAEEEAKAKALQEKRDRWQGAIDDITMSQGLADQGTIKEAIDESDAGKYIGSGMSRARMAGTSEADTAYNASDFITQNKMQNRNQSFVQSVQNAEDLLKSLGFQNEALYNAQAGTLQEQAERQSNLADLLNTVTTTASSFLGRIK